MSLFRRKLPELGPNDTVILEATRPVTEDVARRVREQFDLAVAGSHRAIVLDGFRVGAVVRRPVTNPSQEGDRP